MSKLITENDLKGIFDEILPNDQVVSETVNGTSGSFTVYRCGNVVYFASSFASSASAIATNTTLTQSIPSGYRPISASYLPIVTAMSNNPRMQINPDGSMIYYGDNSWGAGAKIYTSSSWITNDTYPSA